MTSIDLLVVSGGGQIDDYWGGPWGHPFAVLRWTLLAKITGTPVAVASVGFDQLQHPASRMFFRTALRLADYRSYRDRKTLEFVTTELKVRGAGHWVPDLAFSLPARPDSDKAPGGASTKPLVVGISPISHAAWTRADDPVYGRYLSALHELVHRLRKRGVRVRLFPSQVKMDLTPLQAMLSTGDAIGPDQDTGIIVDPVESLDDMLREVDACDIVVAARLHGVLLSVLMHKPVVAVSYSRKVRRLMEELGCPELCLDVGTVTPGNLNDVLDDAIERRAEISALERKTVAEWKCSINQQYLDILSLLD